MPARTPAHPVFNQEIYQADVPVLVDFTATWLHRCGRMPARTRVARPASPANQSVRPSAGARMADRRTQ